MKDRFEEQLNAKLQELESGAGDELDREAIWARIAASQPQSVARPVWRPAVFKIAAAIICLLGTALLLKFLADPPMNKTEQSLAHKPVAQPASVNDMAPHKENEVPQDRHSTPEPAPVAQQAVVTRTEKKSSTPDQRLNGPQPVDQPPVRDDDQPLKQEVVMLPPKVMYLSDLEQETPATHIQPQRNREPGRMARYVKSNLEEYAIAPPTVIINQILSR